MRLSPIVTAVSPVVLALASCGNAPAVDNPPQAKASPDGAARSDFTITEMGSFDEPWAMAFLPGTNMALVTERKGKLKLWQAGRQLRENGAGRLLRLLPS